MFCRAVSENGENKCRHKNFPDSRTVMLDLYDQIFKSNHNYLWQLYKELGFHKNFLFLVSRSEMSEMSYTERTMFVKEFERIYLWQKVTKFWCATKLLACRDWNSRIINIWALNGIHGPLGYESLMLIIHLPWPEQIFVVSIYKDELAPLCP